MAAIAAAGALITFAAEAHADHGLYLALLVGGTPLAQSALVPGYVSTIYYGVNTEKRMPVGWTVMNAITGAMGGSLGFLQLGLAVSETGGSSDKKQMRPLLAAAGGVSIAGSIVVITASVLQTARPNKPTGAPASIIVLPMISMMSPPRSGTTAGLMVFGRL
jgi:hypothetical protein